MTQRRRRGRRLARVELQPCCGVGDLRVTALVSEFGASEALKYVEAAADVVNHWAFFPRQELAEPMNPRRGGTVLRRWLCLWITPDMPPVGHTLVSFA